MLTVEQLQQIMPRLTLEKAQTYHAHLIVAMEEAEITTPLRMAAFLAQLAHESGELRYWQELASGTAYEGRKDLGNIYPGDGPRYKGRGPLQLTGRLNYRQAGNALGIDLEQYPVRAGWLSVGFRVAAWYWTTRKLNDLADRQLFDAITKKINGGYNGKAHRDMYYQKALAVLM